MTKDRLLRWSGLAGVVSGLLLVLLDLAFIGLFRSQPERVAAATQVWLVLLGFSLLAAYLGLVALIGLYVRQLEETGALGLLAFVIASLGTLMHAGFLWAGEFVIPALTSAAPEFLDQVAVAPPTIVAVGFVSTFALFALGWLLFGVASLRARLFPPIATGLLIVGAVLGLISRMVDLGVAGIVYGVALAWLGWWLWKERETSTRSRLQGSS